MSQIVALVIGALLAFFAQQFSGRIQYKRDLQKLALARDDEALKRVENGSQTHQTWLLQKRYETALAFLELVDKVRFKHHLKRPQPFDDAAIEEMQAIATRLGFVGSDRARASTMKLRDALAALVNNQPGSEEEFETARNSFMHDVRELLVIDPPST